MKLHWIPEDGVGLPGNYEIEYITTQTYASMNSDENMDDVRNRKNSVKVGGKIVATAVDDGDQDLLLRIGSEVENPCRKVSATRSIEKFRTRKSGKC